MFYKKGVGLDTLAMQMLPNLEYLSILWNLLNRLLNRFKNDYNIHLLIVRFQIL